jgi:Mce-associated membrane protein
VTQTPDDQTPDDAQRDAVDRLRARAAARRAAAEQPAGAIADGADAGSRSRPASSWREPLAIALVVVAVVGTALTGAAVVNASTRAARASSATAAEQPWSAAQRATIAGAATRDVATVLSYDYRHLDNDFAAAHKVMTPTFRKQYDATTAKGVRPLATRVHAISSAQVTAAGLADALSADRAVVLVFVNQTATNTKLTAPRLDQSRINVTLVRVGGQWLIDKMQTL